MFLNKKTNKEKRRFFLVTLVTLTLMFLMVYNILSVWKDILQMKKEKTFLIKELKNMKEEEAYLKVEVEKLKDPNYIARYAREKYLFSKDGEFNIRIP